MPGLQDAPGGQLFVPWRRFSRLNALVAGVIVVGFVSCVGPYVEAAALGPYTTWFNQRMKARAERAGLVGRPESEVEEVLGRASSSYRFPAARVVSSEGSVRVVGRPGWTFDYYPYPFLPVAKFQVHCHDGVVTGLEMFDD